MPDELALTSAIDALPSCGCQNLGLAGLGVIRSGLGGRRQLCSLSRS